MRAVRALRYSDSLSKSEPRSSSRLWFHRWLMYVQLRVARRRTRVLVERRRQLLLLRWGFYGIYHKTDPTQMLRAMGPLPVMTNLQADIATWSTAFWQPFTTGHYWRTFEDRRRTRIRTLLAVKRRPRIKDFLQTEREVRLVDAAGSPSAGARQSLCLADARVWWSLVRGRPTAYRTAAVGQLATLGRKGSATCFGAPAPERGAERLRSLPQVFAAAGPQACGSSLVWLPFQSAAVSMDVSGV